MTVHDLFLYGLQEENQIVLYMAVLFLFISIFFHPISRKVILRLIAMVRVLSPW